MSIGDLKHTVKNLKSGGMVLVLNTGAVINPESEAMIQALHSRSTGGVKSHLEILAKKGAENFMANFYVGYGHKSIGDCGTITLFVEGISMLAAKAIQDWHLYSGQEASTRYVDFSQQTFLNPVESKEGEEILESWRSFYLDSMEEVKTHLRQQFPKAEDEEEKIYQKAIAARAFDIMRGFLPAGASTNIAWHTNMRQAADKIALLRHHPLAEVQNIAAVMQEALEEAYPSSFSHKLFETTENYNHSWMQNDYYFEHDAYPETTLLCNNINQDLLKTYKNVLESRPQKTELPKFIAECGTLQFGFMLDFGSFRDIQRHRAVIQRMPLLTSRHGFADFYFNSLPENLRQKAKDFVLSQEEKIKNLNLSKELAQYYLAMGYNLPNRVTGDLAALVYLVELRGTRFVHPTLQKRAIEMAKILEKEFSSFGLKLHLDQDPGRFDVKRGEHDIVMK
ncbi:FAD-dependent thymidylate synthase [Candidatus Nomurabacteria bacterium]|nr:FAD-dependent thymidylate synthase [Candidatus Nomurabacteria bacterium]